jgi:hypothetical protein
VSDLHDLTAHLRTLRETVEVLPRQLHDVLTHDRAERDAQIARFEGAAELFSLAVLCQVETLGPTGTATTLADGLARVLRERGVIA